MTDRVRKYIRQYQLLQEGDRVTVGLSGGADSVCLLLCMKAVQEEYRLQLQAVHVHHGLRGEEADRDAAFAESLCLQSPLPRTYLATMQVWDAECAARVARHRAMRAQKQFDTVECPLHLDRLILPRRGTVLLEDLGNLTANELYAPDGAGEKTADAVVNGLAKLAAQCDNLIVVSNEVFRGGADYADDTDRYLLALAQINNATATRADAVVRVVCGIPVYYKGVEK